MTVLLWVGGSILKNEDSGDIKQQHRPFASECWVFTWKIKHLKRGKHKPKFKGRDLVHVSVRETCIEEKGLVRGRVHCANPLMLNLMWIDTWKYPQSLRTGLWALCRADYLLLTRTLTRPIALCDETREEIKLVFRCFILLTRVNLSAFPHLFTTNSLSLPMICINSTK